MLMILCCRCHDSSKWQLKSNSFAANSNSILSALYPISGGPGSEVEGRKNEGRKDGKAERLKTNNDSQRYFPTGEGGDKSATFNKFPMLAM